MTYALRIPTPSFHAPVVDDILALQQLKVQQLVGSTHPEIFFEIKGVFHVLESLGSARIEGNRTTIEELVEATVRGTRDATEAMREISNIEDAMNWIERVMRDDPVKRIDHAFLCELHRLVVKNLRSPHDGGEGDSRPGEFRAGNVRITGTTFVPPSGVELQPLIDELVAFINADLHAPTDLLRVAMAHHRFTHIHPFGNGNGRVVRLLTYAMLIRAGFRVDNGRLINPTAVFCLDRDAYMHALASADAGTESALLDWCTFVIGGLRRELTKIYRMLDAAILIPTILVPTLNEARDRQLISNTEHDVLIDVLAKQVADASVFKTHYPQRSPASLSQVIARYKQRRLIRPTPKPTSRRYVVQFTSALLLRPLIDVLDRAGYLPVPRDP